LLYQLAKVEGRLSSVQPGPSAENVVMCRLIPNPS